MPIANTGIDTDRVWVDEATTISSEAFATASLLRSAAPSAIDWERLGAARAFFAASVASGAVSGVSIAAAPPTTSGAERLIYNTDTSFSTTGPVGENSALHQAIRQSYRLLCSIGMLTPTCIYLGQRELAMAEAEGMVRGNELTTLSLGTLRLFRSSKPSHVMVAA